jgi:hypothetical protein
MKQFIYLELLQYQFHHEEGPYKAANIFHC